MKTMRLRVVAFGLSCWPLACNSPNQIDKEPTIDVTSASEIVPDAPVSDSWGAAEVDVEAETTPPADVETRQIDSIDSELPPGDSSDAHIDSEAFDTATRPDAPLQEDEESDENSLIDTAPADTLDSESAASDIADGISAEEVLDTISLPDMESGSDSEVVDALEGGADYTPSETLCPEWANAFSPTYVHDPCEDLLISPEKFQELLPVPVQCPMPFSEIVQPDAVYDIAPDIAVDVWQYEEDPYVGLWGEIVDLLALPAGGVVFAYQMPEIKQWQWWSPDTTSTQNVRFRFLDSTGASLAVVDIASPISLEIAKWAKTSPAGKPWFAVYSDTFFQTEFGLDEQNNIVELTPNGMVPVYSFPKGSGLKPPDGYPISGGYFLPDGYIGQAPATESELLKSPCYNTVIYRRDLNWNITWKTPWAVMGSDWLNKPGVWPGTPLHVKGCGFVVYGVRPGNATSDAIPPSMLFHVPAFHFFTEAGTHVGTRSYLAGYWGSKSVFGATDGKEVVTARSIEGTIQNPTTWSYTVGVLRLKPDGSLKWFSVLWEPDAVWTSLDANSIIALSSGLTIVAADVNDGLVKVFVIDPAGCVIAAYAFGDEFSGDPVGTYATNFHHMQRLSDGRFVAHDNHRVFFFSLPAVEEWEAALPPAP
jgi:hypothetical protein